MNLTELREAFKSASGFLFWEDALIDEAINNGIKFLDSKTFSAKKDQKVFDVIDAGERAIYFPMDCKVIKEVWIIDDTSKTRLKKENIAREFLTTETGGKPISYSPFTTETYHKTIDQITIAGQFADVTFNYGTSRGILFNCPMDKSYQIEVDGRFYPAPLTETFPENWWSVNHPDTVITAALYVLDINRRNSSGGMELKGPLLDAINEINNDAIEEEVEDQDLVLEG